MLLYFYLYADASPTLAKLSVLRTTLGEKIRIIKRLASCWHRLGILLDFDASGAQLGIIEKRQNGDP